MEFFPDPTFFAFCGAELNAHNSLGPGFPPVVVAVVVVVFRLESETDLAPDDREEGENDEEEGENDE